MRDILRAPTVALAIAGSLLLSWGLSAEAQEPSRAATTVTVGQAAASPGPVSVPVSLDSKGALVRSFQVNFVHAPTISLTGAEPVGLPETWRFASHSPAPGELRVLAFAEDGHGIALSGEAMRLEGVVFEAGISAVGISYVEFRDEPNQALPATIYGGGVLPEPGDLDCDGRVSIQDAIVLLQSLGDSAQLRVC